MAISAILAKLNIHPASTGPSRVEVRARKARPLVEKFARAFSAERWTVEAEAWRADCPVARFAAAAAAGGGWAPDELVEELRLRDAAGLREPSADEIRKLTERAFGRADARADAEATAAWADYTEGPDGPWESVQSRVGPGPAPIRGLAGWLWYGTGKSIAAYHPERRVGAVLAAAGSHLADYRIELLLG